ncbi:hypothetical protein BsWGS_24621 [Bradybaena similaris]
MAVCQFYLQNRCKFGDRCRFEHPRGGSQRNLFNGPSQPWQGGGGSSNTWQGGGNSGGNTWQASSNSQRVTFKDSFGTSNQTSGSHKWTANQQGYQASDNFQQSSSLDLVNSLPKEMDFWEKSHMWPFSCFAVDKDISSLPEFYDISPEELRYEAYQAMKSGNMLPYTQKEQTLQNEFQGKRRQLQNMTMDFKSKLKAVIDEDRKKKQTQPASASSSVFGSSHAPQNVFGQAQASTSAGLFGKSTGAADVNSSNLFGKSTSGSVFGSNFSSRSDNSNSFGSPGASLFGKPVTAGSVFGNQSQGPTTLAPIPFGLVNDNSSPNTSGLFGKTASSGSQVNRMFGQSGNSTVNQSASLFGDSAASQSQGLFGKSFPQQTPGAFPVGASTPIAQMSSLFGSPLSQNQLSTSSFGKPGSTSATPSIFGGTASSQMQGGNVPVQSPASLFGGATSSTASHGHYTPLADLTELETEAFNAKTFTLGRIPLRPPPREMVN